MEGTKSTEGRRILLLSSVSPAVREIGRRLQPEGFALETLEESAGEDALVTALGRSDFLLGFVHRSWSRRVYDAAASLKLIQLLSAGYDRLDLQEVARIGVPVANNGGANAVAVAEHTIMLILAVYRRLVALDQSVRAGGWRPSPLDRLYELEGKRVGIVGLGRIGCDVAYRLRGFGVSLVYYDLFRLPADQEAGLGVAYAALDDLLRTSDVVTLHVPLSPETRSLIGARELGLLKPTAILINTCRGPVVDETALYQALASGALAGAGLDTLEDEPPAADNPLFKLDNVTLTPHTAGPTWDSWPKRFANGYQNIQRVAGGEKPLWVLPELRQLLRS